MQSIIGLVVLMVVAALRDPIAFISAIAMFAFIAMSPLIFCQGGGSGGNCGEGMMASLPLAMLISPVIYGYLARRE